MTNENWEKVEKNLSDIFDDVKLKIDDYEITLLTVPKGRKLEIAVYVNGSIKGENLINDTEIRRRFYNKHIGSVLTADDKIRLKNMPKAKQKAFEEKAKYEWFEPYWRSFRSLKKHLIMNNKSIELMTCKGF